MRNTVRLLLPLSLALPLTAAAVSCGGGATTSGGGGNGNATATGGTSTGSGGTTTTMSTGTGGEPVFVDGGDAGCTNGDPCGDGGVCASNTCCDTAKACAGVCCGTTEVCSFQKCVTPGATCIDATECAAGEYCEYALGETPDGGAPDASCQGGATLATGKCLPKPPECAMGMQPGDPITCLPKCEYKPPVGQFTPVLKYSWGAPKSGNPDSVMMAPVVVQLDDDNCDGVVDERDTPEIVFLTFANSVTGAAGTLHAVSVQSGTMALVEKWASKAPLPSENDPGASIAAGDIDGVPGNEIVVITADNRVRAYKADGTELWLSSPFLPDDTDSPPSPAPPVIVRAMPAIADLDQDGQPEIVIGSQVLDGKTGMAKIAAFTPPNKRNLVPYDLDGDGKLDLVGPDRVYAADGMQIASTGVSARYLAIADLDKDGKPEVVATDYKTHTLVIWQLDSTQPNGVKILRQGVDINGTLSVNLCNAGTEGNTKGGGPPLIADLNGDGIPDVGVAGGVGYAAFDGAKLMDAAVPNGQTFLWIKQTQDCRSASTGSSAFDLDGDGRVEVFYGDETKLHVYDGLSGMELGSICNTNDTLQEYPVIADVDRDGQADLVLVSNSHTALQCNGNKNVGVRVFGDMNGNWVRARSIWNQHAYHVTNVNEDGTIPKLELPNISQNGLNNFRQSIHPQGALSAADLIASIAPVCTGPYALVAKVHNVGSAPVPAGVAIGFYSGDPMNGGVPLPGSPVLTSRVLYPAESEDVLLALPNPPAGIQDGSVQIFAYADDFGGHAWHECRTDNNVSKAGSGKCGPGAN